MRETRCVAKNPESVNQKLKFSRAFSCDVNYNSRTAPVSPENVAELEISKRK